MFAITQTLMATSVLSLKVLETTHTVEGHGTAGMQSELPSRLAHREPLAPAVQEHRNIAILHVEAARTALSAGGQHVTMRSHLQALATPASLDTFHLCMTQLKASCALIPLVNMLRVKAMAV